MEDKIIFFSRIEDGNYVIFNQIYGMQHCFKTKIYLKKKDNLNKLKKDLKTITIQINNINKSSLIGCYIILN